MGRLILSEEEKNRIRGLYEQNEALQPNFLESKFKPWDFENYKQKFGNDFQGFVGIQFSSDSLIKNVMNYFEGGSSKSKRNELNPYVGLAGDSKGTLGFTFNVITEGARGERIYFSLLKDGKEIKRSSEFVFQWGEFQKTMCTKEFFIYNLSEPGKYTITNSWNNSYYLTFEI